MTPHLLRPLARRARAALALFALPLGSVAFCSVLWPAEPALAQANPPRQSQSPVPAGPDARLLASLLETVTWQRYGPSPIPCGSTGEPGLWRTDDDGLSWRCLAGSCCGQGIGAVGVGGDGEAVYAAATGWASLVAHPTEPEVLYLTAAEGVLLRLDTARGEARDVSVWPDLAAGRPTAELEYRFAPRLPLFPSPHDDEVLYAAGNFLFMTADDGQSWQAISPPLAEGTGAITAAFESPAERGVFWVGSDQGDVFLSRDYGATWTDETPPELPAGARVTVLAPSPADRKGLFLAAALQGAEGGFLVLRSGSYGRHWKNVTAGLAEGPVHALAPDPEVAGLVFAGTDQGVSASFDGGETWHGFGLEGESARWLGLRGATLLAVTGGGILAGLDLTAVRQLDSPAAADGQGLLTPPVAVRRPPAGPLSAGIGGRPAGVPLYFLLRAPEPATEVTLDVLREDGTAVRSFSSTGPDAAVSARAGLNLVVWDLRHPGTLVPGPGGPALELEGPMALPGNYLVRLRVGENSTTAQLKLLPDPDAAASREALEAQIAFLNDVHLRLGVLAAAARALDAVEGRLEEGLAAAGPEAREALGPAAEALESALGDARARAGDPANPSHPGHRLAVLARRVGISSDRPTEQAVALRDRLAMELGAVVGILGEPLGEPLAAFNEAARAHGAAPLEGGAFTSGGG